MYRDRSAGFELRLSRKHQARLRGLDAEIVTLRAKGLSNNEIGACAPTTSESTASVRIGHRGFPSKPTV
jgi:transposase-like protein